VTAGPDEGEARSVRATPEPQRHQPPPRHESPPPTPPLPQPQTATPAIEPKPAAALTHGDLWARTLESVGEKPSALARLESISLVRLEGSVAFIRPVSAAHASRVKAGVSWFEARFTEAAGRTIRVKIENPADDAGSPPPPGAHQPGLTDAAIRREAEGNKLVRTAMDLFQARLVSVEDDPASRAAQIPDDTEDTDDGDDD
jgi:hypothetical protein